LTKPAGCAKVVDEQIETGDEYCPPENCDSGDRSLARRRRPPKRQRGKDGQGERQDWLIGRLLLPTNAFVSYQLTHSSLLLTYQTGSLI